MTRCIQICVIFFLTFICGGCASFPAGTKSTVGRQITVSMTVAGPINPAQYYFFVINANSTTNSSVGPVPVISAPWGNGFVAGTATHFVEYSQSLPGNGYAVYQFIPGTNLQQFTGLAPPVSSSPVANGTTNLQFRIPLAELGTTAIPASSIQTLQINFVNTNFLPVNPDDVTPSTPKYFDALGNTTPGSGQLNNFISVTVNQDGTYSNSVLNDEPQGDVVSAVGGGVLEPVSQPSLDIIDWSVQITG